MKRQTRTLAVMFADISDSTSLYQKLGDAAARNIVNACLQVINGVLARYEGRLVKTIGDEVMCVFPDADLAVLAASDMQAQVSATKPGNYPVSIHVGLHYGPVLIEENDVFGDTVNVAAYLRAAATAEQILTTDAVERCLTAALKTCVRPIFNAVLKGSEIESTVFQVLWRTGIVIGRSKDCDLVVTDNFASRRHLSIKLVRTHFYLFDHSINGTFVTLGSGEEVHVLRRELLLDGSGEIYVGRSRVERPAGVITFEPDRRSMYRV